MPSPRLSRRANHALAYLLGGVGAALLVVGFVRGDPLYGVLGALMVISGWVLVPRSRRRTRR